MSSVVVKTSLKLPSDLLADITRKSEEWAVSQKIPPQGKRNMWIIKVLREAVATSNNNTTNGINDGVINP